MWEFQLQSQHNLSWARSNRNRLWMFWWNSGFLFVKPRAGMFTGTFVFHLQMDGTETCVYVCPFHLTCTKTWKTWASAELRDMRQPFRHDSVITTTIHSLQSELPLPAAGHVKLWWLSNFQTESWTCSPFLQHRISSDCLNCITTGLKFERRERDHSCEPDQRRGLAYQTMVDVKCLQQALDLRLSAASNLNGVPCLEAKVYCTVQPGKCSEK